MRRAEFVHVDREAGILADERAGGPGVVQVDVREEDGVEIAHGEAMSLKTLTKSIERGAWARVHDGMVAVRFEQRGSYGARPAHPEIVECGDGRHEKSSVTQERKVGSWQEKAARKL